MSWTLVYGDKSYKILDISLSKTLNGLNNATVMLREYLPLHSYVTIKHNDDVYMVGVVTNVNQDEHGLYTYTVVEYAVVLDYLVLEKDGSFNITITEQTVNDIVDFILDFGWEYRIPITIENTLDVALEDYQICFTFDHASLVSNGKSKSDASDILITDSDGITKLPFWIEPDTINTSECRVWVKVQHVPARGKKTIYMYYGNPNATSYMVSPEDIFDLYDDFDGDSLDSSKWETTGTSVSVSDGNLVLGSGSGVRSKNPVDNKGACLEVGIYFDDYSNARVGITASDELFDLSKYSHSITQSFNTSGYRYYKYFSIASSRGEYTTSEEHELVVSCSIMGDSVYIWLDYDSSDLTKYTLPKEGEDIYSRYVEIYVDTVNSGSVKIGWVRLRKRYANKDPSITMGSEETKSTFWWTRGSDDTSTVEAISFSYSTKLQALFKLIRDVLGKHVWFDNENRVVYFGDSRTNRGAVQYLKKQVEQSGEKRQVDRVVVFSNDESVYGSYGQGVKVAMFKYSDAKTKEECNKIAERIYNELRNRYERISIQTPIQPIDEGDIVEVDGQQYIVYQVETNQYDQTLHLNNSKKSIFDILGSKLIEMTGTVRTGKLTTINYDGGKQHVDPSYPATWNIYIDDKSLIKSFKISIKTYPYKSYTIVKETTEEKPLDDQSKTIENDTFGDECYSYSTEEQHLLEPGETWTVWDKIITVHTSMVFVIVTGLAAADIDGAEPIDLEVYVYDGTRDYPSDHVIVPISYGSSANYPFGNFTVVIPIPGDKFADMLRVRIRNTTDNRDVGLICHVYIICFARHIHNLNVDTTKHSHPVTVNYDIKEVESYPMDMDVYVNDNHITYIEGDDTSSVEVTNIDITSKLKTGMNTIKIVSSTKGIIALSGVIERYSVE